VSLINDALKKAREDEAANTIPGRNRMRREENAPSQGKLVALALAMGGVIIILLSVIIVALIQLFRAPVRATEGKTAVLDVVAVEKPSDAAAQAATELPVQEPLPALPVPPEKPAAELPPPASAPLQPEILATLKPEAIPATVTPDAEALSARPLPPSEPPTLAIPAPDTKIAEFVQSIQIRGAGKSKILLFVPGTAEAVAYAEGDTIDSAYELVIVSLTARSLVFEDARGVRYTKPL
jgi:hypothetical protein